MKVQNKKIIIDRHVDNHFSNVLHCHFELLRKYVNNVFCVLYRSVRCDLRNATQICFLQRLFERFILVIMLDHLIVNFSDRLVSLLANDACSFSIIEWRMSVLDLSNDVCSFSIFRATFWRERLIKFDESDSSNLTKKDVISSNLTKASSH